MVLLKFVVLLILKGLLPIQAESLLPKAIKYALASSFNNSADEVNIVIEIDFDENKAFFLDIVNIILKENWNFPLQLNINNEVSRQCGEFNLWFIDSYRAFGRLLPWIQANHRDSQLYYFIILKTSAPKMLYINEIENIFSDFLLLMVANVNVIIETDSEGVLFYTFVPYQENACRSTKPLLTHRFNDSSFNIKKPFFPSKVDNFQGCPLRVKTRNELILNMANFNKPKLLENYEMSILEVIMLEEFAFRMNFIPEIYEFFEDVHSTNSELPISVADYDILLGYIRNGPDENYYYSKTVPYYLSWMVIALYPQLNKFRTYAWFLEPFTLITWICIVVSLLLIAGCIFLTKTTRIKRILTFLRFRDSQVGGLDIISLVIGASIQHLPSTFCLRYSLISISLGALVIRTAYLGKIFDAFRGRTMLIPPHSIKELFAKNYTIFTEQYFKSIIDDLNEMEYENVEYILDPTKTFELFNVDKQVAVITTFTFLYTFLPTKKRTSLMMEAVLREHRCIFFHKHSFILPKIIELTMKMEEAGILHYFRKGFENINDAQFLKSQEDQEPEALGLESFVYIFYLGIVFYGISFLVFLIELFWQKTKKFSV